jgi:hypothetical protein
MTAGKRNIVAIEKGIGTPTPQAVVSVVHINQYYNTSSPQSPPRQLDSESANSSAPSTSPGFWTALFTLYLFYWILYWVLATLFQFWLAGMRLPTLGDYWDRWRLPIGSAVFLVVGPLATWSFYSYSASSPPIPPAHPHPPTTSDPEEQFWKGLLTFCLMFCILYWILATSFQFWLANMGLTTLGDYWDCWRLRIGSAVFLVMGPLKTWWLYREAFR